MHVYEKNPYVAIRNHQNAAWMGYEQIVARLKQDIERCFREQSTVILVLDCYPGVNYEEIRKNLIRPLDPAAVFFTDEEIFQSGEHISSRVKERMTEDRVFGQMCLETYKDLLEPEGLSRVRTRIVKTKGLIILYGAGANIPVIPDIYVYADLARWEIQQRLRRNQITNWKHTLGYTDNLMKFKWGFFFEWRVADRHKKKQFEAMDYILDTNLTGMPKMLTGEAFRDGLQQAAARPFRLVPFFDPGIWGGQWMKEVCDLDRGAENYAWCFDCVPEENSLLLGCDNIVIEIPAMDLVLYQPVELLGKKVHARFGAEFPIRFDFLDTMGGQNLSLQVHPLVDGIQEKFGMHYTQEESYYVLDVGKEGTPVVYLGVKTGVSRESLFQALEEAQTGKEDFPAETMINAIPVKKHDHILIPPGTIHCSGRDTMILEISATPYIFTFKLWDWGRLGLDGRPRPVHLAYGKEAIQMDRDTAWVKGELVNQVQTLREEEGYQQERTGLHELEFIETTREWFSREILCKTEESVNVLNLVEGEAIEVKSPKDAFSPFLIHYAETFIVPESVKEYLLCPVGNTESRVGVICARVRVEKQTW